MKTRLYPRKPQPVGIPLKSFYCFFGVAQALLDFKASPILVLYNIVLNGKGVQMFVVYMDTMETVLLPLLFFQIKPIYKVS